MNANVCDIVLATVQYGTVTECAGPVCQQTQVVMSRNIPATKSTMSRFSSTAQLSLKQQVEIRQVFKVFDADSSGTISFKELRLAIRALGLEVQQRDIKQLLQSMDLNQNGQIELEEFEALVARSGSKLFVVIVTTCNAWLS